MSKAAEHIHSPPTCKPCQTASIVPAHNLFSPACLHCGARMIQRLGLLPIPASEIATRRRQVLVDWAEFGHQESQIRALAKGPLAIAPK